MQERSIKRCINSAIIVAPLWLLLLLLFSLPIQAKQTNAQGNQLHDVDFGNLIADGQDETIEESACIYTSGQQGKYWVTATGTGPSGAFLMQSGSDHLTYHLYWGRNNGPYNQLTPNSRFPGQNASNAIDCPNGPTASIKIVLPSTEISTASAGSYHGTLSLLIEPRAS